jgi:hypothetical protein
MNATETDVGRRQQAEAASRLLKEYADKLNALAVRLLDLPERGLRGGAVVSDALVAEAGVILDGYYAVAPTLESLTRATSQMLEHFDLDKWTELELKLRLRETEQALDAVQNAIATLKKIYGRYLPEAKRK